MSAEWDKVEEAAAVLRHKRAALATVGHLRRAAENAVHNAQTEYDEALWNFQEAKREFAPGGGV